MITTQPRPPHNGTATSIAAAQDAIPKVKRDRKAITAFIAKMEIDGATDDEISRALPTIHANALRARRGECWGYGLITDSLGLTRATSTGSMAKCWHVTLEGVRRLGLDTATHWHAEKQAVAK